MSISTQSSENQNVVIKSRGPRERFSRESLFVILSIHILAVVGIILYPPEKNGLIAVFVGQLLFVWLGASLGFHRLISHRSFECSTFVRRVFAVLGTLSLQGGPLLWARHHRAHHRFTEDLGDPHSAARGFLWSHLLWMLYLNPNGYKKSLSTVKDLEVDKFLVFLDKNHLYINLVFFLSVLLVNQNPSFLFWFFPIRIVFGWHSTWLINSYAHKAWSHSGNTMPTNSWLPTLLICGEGWHLNHHENPSNPNNSKNLFQPDFGYWILLVLNFLKIIKLRVRNRRSI